ncbi:MAG: electron transporter RnfB [Bacilli bacterium]|nr:electron transporter RnfB [Bacilli bacterium]
MGYLYILYGFLILVAIGIILGVVLVFASKKFKVEEDPRIDAVEKMLPGANCGACGFPGCRGLAEGLVSGEVKKCSTCKVGKKDKHFDLIIEYMKAHPDKDGKTNVPTL